ncbi:MAG: amidohydrolase family protein [Chloroflexi bacterium]|nr:amidohydrolase family protein [Chloroflexota bacterium]
MFDLVISGGTVVSPTSSREMDVAIQAGKIVALALPGALDGSATRAIDGRGLYVLPGAIDPHTHIFPEFLGLKLPGFDVATQAAAFGGTTTVIDFAFQREGMTIQQALDQRLAEIGAKSSIDYSLHATLTAPSWGLLDELDATFARGVPSFKVLLHEREGKPPEEALCLVLLQEVAARNGVVTVHAENGSLVTYFTRKLLAEGRTGQEYFSAARPAIAEAESVERMIFLAEKAGAAVYFVHLSSADAVDLVAGAKARGLPVYGETCPQYLAFTDEVYKLPNRFQLFVFPPIKGPTDRDAMWQGVVDGAIDTIGTDYVAGYLWRKLELYHGKRFDEVRGGAGQVETMLPFMFSEGVGKGRITVNRLVEITSANPARIFGLYPRKGVVAVGSDADLVLYSPTIRRTMTSAGMHMGLDYCTFEGWEFVGAPVMTVSRGVVLVEDGRYVGPPGHGQFLARKIGPEVLRPKPG